MPPQPKGDTEMSEFDFSTLKAKPTELDKRAYTSRTRANDPAFTTLVQQSWDADGAMQIDVPNAEIYAVYAGLRRAAEDLGMGVSIQPVLKAAELKALRDSGKGSTVVKFAAKERKQKKAAE